MTLETEATGKLRDIQVALHYIEFLGRIGQKKQDR